MEKYTISENIIKSLTKLFNIDIDLNDNYNCQLTGYPIYLDSCQLLYLFFFLEKEYNIEFTKDDVLNYNFNSIKSITLCIYRKLKSMWFNRYLTKWEM